MCLAETVSDWIFVDFLSAGLFCICLVQFVIAQVLVFEFVAVSDVMLKQLITRTHTCSLMVTIHISWYYNNSHCFMAIIQVNLH